MRVRSLDRVIIILFYFSIVIGMYYNGLSQSFGQERTITPRFFLILPFVIAFLQLVRIITMSGRVKLDSLGRSWVYIIIYYIFAFLLSRVYGISQFKYNVYWFVVCPPLSWIYFSVLLGDGKNIVNYLLKWAFGFFVIVSGITIYFIPRSIDYSGHFASLNNGYYVLFAYPMVMLVDNKMKKTIATILMVLLLLFSLKRGGIIAVGLSFSLYILFSSKAKIIVKIIITAIFVGILLFLLPRIDKITNGTLMARYEFTQNEGDENGRKSMYPLVWESVRQSSSMEIVFGHGHNAVVSNNVLQGLSAHNDYLEFLYDYGIIGFFLLLIFHFKLFSITIRAWKTKTGFLGSIVASTSIVVLSMVSIVYAYQYFLLIIPFFCVINRIIKSNIQSKHESRNTYI